MKRFSFKASTAVAFLHIAGSIWLISAALARMPDYDRGETFPWLTGLSWLWMPVPVLLTHHFHLNPSYYFYYLALPWSLVVALGCGFVVPYFSRRRHRLT